MTKHNFTASKFTFQVEVIGLLYTICIQHYNRFQNLNCLRYVKTNTSMKLDINDKEIYEVDEEFTPKKRKTNKLHKMKRNYN